MRRFLLKSRKLSLLLLLGFRFATMGISLFNVNGAVVAVPLSTLGPNLDINTDDRFNSELLYDGREMHKASTYRYQNDGSSYIEEHPEAVAAQRSRSVIIQSEAGPIQTSYNLAFKSSPKLNGTISEETFSEDDIYRESYTATTPKIIGSTSKELERYDDDYYLDDNESEEENKQDEDSDKRGSHFLSDAINLWDIFSALNTAWNTIGQEQLKSYEHQTEDAEEERLRRNSNYTTNVTPHPNAYYAPEAYKQQTISQTLQSSTETAIAEGRYIKGDPLKGYYDFVITEGSYKFWAAFQLATAVLIIYSTFAAIYYSKVNPLVGDYDYVDYLGGARSISDDSDFVDAPDNGSGSSAGDGDTSPNAPGWLSILHKDWMPRVGHTAKFILEAIDKIPQQS